MCHHAASSLHAHVQEEIRCSCSGASPVCGHLTWSPLGTLWHPQSISPTSEIHIPRDSRDSLRVGRERGHHLTRVPYKSTSSRLRGVLIASFANWLSFFPVVCFFPEVFQKSFRPWPIKPFNWECVGVSSSCLWAKNSFFSLSLSLSGNSFLVFCLLKQRYLFPLGPSLSLSLLS